MQVKSFIKCVLIILFVAICFVPAVTAAEPYTGYNFDQWDNPVFSQNGYTLAFEYSLYKEGGEEALCDMFVSDEGEIYILKSSEILILDKNFNEIKTIDSFTHNGEERPLSSPRGIFVDKHKRIYIADTENKRVIVCDQNGNIQKTYLRPVSGMYPDTMDFKPTKVVADNASNVYVLCEGGYFGALIYDVDGVFSGFYGSNKVEVTFKVLTNRMWKKIMSKEQKDRFERFVPVEYNSFDIDGENFIYTCTNSTSDSLNELKKLNPAGKNILPAADYGDREKVRYNGIITDTSFTDICVDGQKYINVLDFSRKRIYQYDNDGNLLFVFGTEGNYKGGFVSPAAVDSIGDKILVLDRDKYTITVFELTEFGSYVHTAIELYNDGLYKEAVPAWENVIRLNSNYRAAYTGIGKAKILDNDYEGAMKYYKLGYNRELFSQVYGEYRTAQMKKFFPLIVLLFAILIFLILSFVKKDSFLMRKIKERRKR